MEISLEKELERVGRFGDQRVKSRSIWGPKGEEQVDLGPKGEE